MKTRPVIFIIPLMLLILALITGFSLVFRLFFLSVLVILASYFWTRFGIRGIEVRAGKPPPYCQAGAWFEQEVTIYNHSKMPKLFLELEENVDLPGQHSLVIFNLPPGLPQTYQTRVSCQRRGRHQVGTFRATLGDPLGLFTGHRNLGEAQAILIYPRTVALPFFEPLNADDLGSGRGRELYRQASPGVSSVREYNTGDSLNRIHWRSTARTGKLMVKVFDVERSRDSSQVVWIIIDLEQSRHGGEGEETTEEYSATIAASLVKRCQDRGAPVGIMAWGESPYSLPPERGETHLRQLMAALALMRAKGRVPVGQLITDNLERFRNASVIIITPSGGGVASASRKLISQGNPVVTILLETPDPGGEQDIATTLSQLNAAGARTFLARRGSDLARLLDNRTVSSIRGI